ncbi:MAG TPA: helix-turn-helix domain-containing protein [Candidatus Acidoferrales bacterium]|nr:helix-turn-helix domain-containing protein [Candidatus Acidoferrales bacterium]
MKDRLSHLLTVRMAAEYLGCSRQAVWDAVKRRRLETVQVGKVVLITRASVARYRKTRRPGGPRRRRKKT